MVTKEQLDAYTKAWSQGNPQIDDSTYDELLEEFSIRHVEKRKGTELSGGERRRVEIAESIWCHNTYETWSEDV